MQRFGHKQAADGSTRGAMRASDAHSASGRRHQHSLARRVPARTELTALRLENGFLSGFKALVLEVFLIA